MPITFLEGPPNGTTLVATALSAVSERRAPSGLGLRLKSVQSPQIGRPHRVYDLQLNELAAHHRLQGARYTSVRYLVASDDSALAAAEVQLDESGKAVLLLGMNYGSFVAETINTVDALADNPLFANDSYEARLLRCSALYVMAIWLHAPDLEEPADNLFIPLRPAPTELSPGEIYEVESFFGAIEPLAARHFVQGGGPSIP